MSSPGDEDEGPTATLTLHAPGADLDLTGAQLELLVLAGPDAGRTVTTGARATIGSHPSADLALQDDTVSRRHAELRAVPGGVLLVDLGSKNGTKIGGIPVREALLRPGDSFDLGSTRLTAKVVAPSAGSPGEKEARPTGVTRFGAYLTRSPALASALELLRRASASNATVLIEGETGTGKELLARAVHDGSPRARGPYVVVDCGGVTATLLESQLFGHKKGAFTGAAHDVTGAFEAANGGTVFLDELGELPLELQPKLLRALEARTVRRLGEVHDRPIDVRFVAATHRNLEELTRSGQFRSDLFYRVAVVRAKVPPLRQRPEDVEVLAEEMIRAMSGGAKVLTPEAISALGGYDWPGNARELRNVLEQALAVAEGSRLSLAELFPGSAAEPEPGSFHEAKDQVVASFERRYVRGLLERAGGNISRAAKESGLSRNALYALMRRCGIESS